MPRPRWVCAALVSLGLLGCGDKTLFVESNAPWEGTVDGVGAVTGESNGDFDVSEVDGEVCWTLRKTTMAGVLRAYVEDEGAFGLGTNIEGLETTNEPYGEVTGCAG
ncbi:MAG: hypothetical protein ACREMH_04440 [Gemmatimonadales bacterium]